jgi:hypothetical protein
VKPEDRLEALKAVNKLLTSGNNGGLTSLAQLALPATKENLIESVLAGLVRLQ